MILIIHAKPNSKKPGIEKLTETEWVVRIKSLPVEGKANEELIRRIAEELDTSPSKVQILQGGTGKKKKILVDI
ncbi:UPF0235 protein [Leptospira kobayashii]|uniref:UPF0235 protein n=1 Tax=Leptospira kobayashii TaxID=1917830 RepID=A0ABM7UKQ6_9LEPT|nr:DUF167 domain-containing protein [Leptospira kobayashii]BDA79487.1 UPF0235 protein [Leptospira kobayashii]